MQAPRYYSLMLYGPSPFPKFVDSLKTRVVLNRWIAKSKADGFTLIEVYRDKPRAPGQIGIERELIEIIGE